MLIQSLIDSSKYGVKCPYSMSPKGICVHNTANDASAKNEISYMKSNNNEVSFHIAIDDVEAIQAIPFNRNAWAAGDGGSGNGNRNYIHIEICYSKSGGTRFNQAEDRAAKEIAALLKQFGWTIDNVKKHQDFSGKYCPHRTLDLGWQRFLNKIKPYLDTSSNQSNSGPVASNTFKVGDKVTVSKSATHYATGQAMASFVKGSTYTVQEVKSDRCLLSGIVSWVYNKDLSKVGSTLSSASYTVRIDTDVLNVRTGPSTDYKVATTVKKNEVYTIVEEKNGFLKLKSGAGWISKKYVKKM